MIDSVAVRRTVLAASLVVAGSIAVAGPAGAAVQPAVTGLSAGSGPVGGGNTVALTGSGFAAGVRVLFGSHAGTHVRVQSRHRLTVVAPAHAASSVHVRVARGSATSSGRAADRYLYTSAPRRISWQPWRKVDPDRAALADVSCPTTTFCLAVDASAFYLTYDGHGWSAPKSLPVADAVQVSCPDATTCTVAGRDGKVATWQAGVWSSVHAISGFDGAVENLSCPTSAFCMLSTFEAQYATERDGVWSAPQHQPDTFNATSMDCTSATFCLLVDGDGVTIAWDGTAWHEQAAGDKFATSLSCASPTFCVTVESYFHGRVFTWNGTTWSEQTLADEPRLYDVDCPTATSCVAVGRRASWRLSGTNWTSVPIAARTWNAVACASVTACVTVGDRQFAAGFDGTSWGTPVVVETASGRPSDVACSSSLFCMLVDESGAAVEYLRGTWQKAKAVYVGGRLTAIACPRSSFCLAVGSGGRTATWNGSTWAAPVAHAGFGTFADVSCASTTSCVAASGNHALHWTGSGWRTTTIAHASVVRALDCPTTTYCLAATAGGYAVSWNGHSWSTARHVVGSALSVACGAARECYVGSPTSTVAALHGAMWSRQYTLGGGSVVGISCPSSTFCAAAATVPLDAIDYQGFTRIPVFRGAAVNAKVAKHQWSIVALSCPTSHFCALADDFGGAVVGTR